MSKIFANFNLNQSLSNFQLKITELLKLNNVNEWSGTTIKEREEKIREAALILAGQCIGVLLNDLSKSPISKLYSNPFYIHDGARKRPKRMDLKTGKF